MIATYQFEAEGLNAEIRVAGTPEKPCFVVNDVCAVLEITNVTEATKKLDADELTSVILNSGGQNREMLAVTESGLYHLIFKSRKPAAKVFRRWVTEEVLPALRKTGRYVMPAAPAAETVMTAPVWLESMGLDLVEHASTCQLLMERVERAVRQLRFQQASFRERDGFQLLPVPVLRLAEGFYRRDLTAPVNRHHFFETSPRLPDAMDPTA